MSKALVIKGASFASNKVETITLTQPIPCTGLSVSPTTVSFTAINETQQLTVTKTPADTTDTVSYASSNESVATVSDSGIVTCVGIGSATITVTCGEQSATCAVTSTVIIVLDTAYHKENGKIYSGSMDLSAVPPRNHIGKTTGNGRVFYSTEEYGTYRAFAKQANAGQYLIPLPNGATQATIVLPTGMEGRHVYLVLGNSNEKQTYVTGADGNSALGIIAYIAFNTTEAEKTFDISSYAANANGFILSWELYSTSQTDESSITGTTSIVFS